MSDVSLRQFITKKEVEQRFGRSHRSLTRDFSTAVRTGDEDVLKHLKLRTEDDNVRSGTEVTLELIQDLSNKGLTPTWYVHSTWAEDRYGSRSKERAIPNAPAKEDKPPEQQSPAGSSEPGSEVIAILKGQLHKSQEDHRQDKERFDKQIDMLKDMFDTLKDDHSDTKALLKQVHAVIDKLADRNQQDRKLAPPDSQSTGTKANDPDSQQQTAGHAPINSVIDADVLEVKSNEVEKISSKKNQTVARKRNSSASSPKPKSAPASTRQSKKKVVSKKKGKPPLPAKRKSARQPGQATTAASKNTKPEAKQSIFRWFLGR